MTVHMPQPQPMTPADLDDIAIFLLRESNHAPLPIRSALRDTARHLALKSEGMRQSCAPST